MFATGGTPPPMDQAQSFTIHTRLTNTSGFRHKLRQKLTRPLHLDQGIVFPPMPSGLVYLIAVDTASTFHIHFPTSTPENPPHSNFSLQSPNNTTICSPPIAHPSRSGSLCVYDAGYSGGIFGIDEFQLLSPFPSSSSTSRIAFGCDLQSQVDFNGGWDFNPIGGMIGLGKGHPSSIVSQLGSDRYSYCLPGFAQSQSGQPTLNFGSDAIIDANATNVQTTPLISSTLSSAPEKFYNYLNMTAVTVNGDVVYMMPENSSANLVLLDSGSQDSWLIEDAIFSLQDSIVKYFAESYGWKHPKIESESARGYPCCYDLPSDLASVVFPKVALQFLGGASLELHNAFEIFAAEHEFCMVIREGAPNRLVSLLLQQVGDLGLGATAVAMAEFFVYISHASF
ncbi:hypothetical protein ACLB2K_061018 [Fragaria x ananassa]